MISTESTTSSVSDLRESECLDCGGSIEQRKHEGGFWLPRICVTCDATVIERFKLQETERARGAFLRRLSCSGMPVDFFDGARGLDAFAWTPEQASVRDALRRFGANELGKPFVMIEGPAGVGKTTLCRCAMTEWARKGHNVREIPAPDLGLIIRDSYKRDSDLSEREIIEDLRRVPLLLIDDFGAERATTFVTNALFAVIDGRYRRKAPTLITTNCSVRELADRLVESSGDQLVAERLIDRLIESSHLVRLNGKSHRLRLAKQAQRWRVPPVETAAP